MILSWTKSTDMIASFMTVVAAIVSIIGTNAMKYSHTKNSRKPPAQQVVYFMRSDWWIAFTGVAFGGLSDFFAMGISMQTYYAGLGGATALIANVLFAQRYNKEELNRSDLVGIFFVLVSVVIFARSGTLHDAVHYTPKQLVSHFISNQFIIYLIIQVILILVLLGMVGTTEVYKWRGKMTESLLKPLVKRLRYQERQQVAQIKVLERRIRQLESTLQISSSSSSGNLSVSANGDEDERTNSAATETDTATVTGTDSLPLVRRGSVLDLTLEPEESTHLQMDHWSDQYVYAATSGIVGGLSVILAGCLSKIIYSKLLNFQSGYHVSDLSHWQLSMYASAPYLMSICLGVTLIVQMHLLNLALIMGEIMTVFPMFQGFWIFFSVLGGVVFYDRGTVDFYGGSFLLVGTYFLVRTNRKKHKADRKRRKGEGEGVDVSTGEATSLLSGRSSVVVPGEEV